MAELERTYQAVMDFVRLDFHDPKRKHPKVWYGAVLQRHDGAYDVVYLHGLIGRGKLQDGLQAGGFTGIYNALCCLQGAKNEMINHFNYEDRTDSCGGAMPSPWEELAAKAAAPQQLPPPTTNLVVSSLSHRDGEEGQGIWFW